MVHVKDFTIYGHRRLRKMLLAGSMTVFLFLYGIVGIDIPSISNNNVVEAQSSAQEFSGWAWSSNVGWISFNCSNTNTCSSVNYKVLLNTDNTITGYAWSDNAGWLKFGGLSSFPVGSGTVSSNAKINNGKIEGWARFCAGTSSGTCSSMTSRTDGWDGWVSMGGTATQGEYSTVLNGYIWGSDVIGWTQWDPEFGGVEIGNPFDFSMTGPSSITLEKGQSISRTVSFQRLSGLPSLVTLGNPSVNSNIEVLSLPKTCTPDNSCSVTFTVKAKSNANPATYPVNLFATGGSVTRNASFNVVVPQDLSISCFSDPTTAKTAEDVVWTAAPSSPGSYTYRWVEDGVTLGNTSQSVTRSYNNPGQKNMVVSIPSKNISASCGVIIEKKPIYDEF